MAADIQQILHATAKDVPKGSTVTLRGQVQTMNSAFLGLSLGLVGAIVLIYLLIVVNFQSWADAFVIVTALPAALAGIVWMLFTTHTPLSVPALTGAILCMGVATANSILVVSFARERLAVDRQRAGRRNGSRLHALPPGVDDRARDDHRHGADGARPRRRRRTERAARPRGDRRPDLRDLRHAAVRARRIQPRAPPRCGKHPPVQRSKIILLPTPESSMSTEIEINSPKRLRHLKLVGIVVLLAAAGVVTTGIVSRVHAKQEMTAWSAAQAVPTVVAYTPNRQGATQSLVLPGHLSAFVNAPIYARVPGYLHAWYADIGTHVKAGQLLGVIDTPDLDQQLRRPRRICDNAQANEKLAASTAQRWTEMLAQDAVSQQDADEKTSDLAAKLAIVAAAQANVQRLEALESFKRITAPFDGIVTARKTDIGALINAGGGDGHGTLHGLRCAPAARLCQRAAERRRRHQARHDRDADRA